MSENQTETVTIRRSDGRLQQVSLDELDRLNTERKVRDQNSSGRRFGHKEINRMVLIFSVLIAVGALLAFGPQTLFHEDAPSYKEPQSLERAVPLAQNSSAPQQDVETSEPVESSVDDSSSQLETVVASGVSVGVDATGSDDALPASSREEVPTVDTSVEQQLAVSDAPQADELPVANEIFADDELLNLESDTPAGEESLEISIEEVTKAEKAIAAEEIKVADPVDQQSALNDTGSDRAKSALQLAFNRWLGAWINQDVNLYLLHYSNTFSPDNGLGQAAWAAQRRRKIPIPEWIQINVSNFVLEMDASGSIARMTFHQAYQASNYQDQSMKVMEWRLEQGQWKIIVEQSAKFPATP